MFFLSNLTKTNISFSVQDNRELQNRISQSTADVGEMRSMHDELSILEESG